MSRNDTQTRFHREWLGLAQPIEGLVFSVPVLADAQITPATGPELSARFKEQLVHVPDLAGKNRPDKLDEPVWLEDLRTLFKTFLGYDAEGMLVERDALPMDLHFYAEEGRQDIRPSFAIARGPFEDDSADDLFGGFGSDEPEDGSESSSSDDEEASPYLALVWDVRDDADQGTGLSLDKAEDATGSWRYPPTSKLERLLRHTGVPIGLLSNGRELRLVYAPAAESTSHLTFRFADMAEPAGRPLLAAFELLMGARRTYQASEEHTLEGLLRESRRRQADVTKDLAAQVFEAVEILLEGFEQASARDASSGLIDWLRPALDAPHDHLYQGVLSVVLRLVFLLYSEDQALLPVGHPIYAKYMSVQGLYDDLVADVGMHPESMHHRFGAYGRLLSLFRAIFLGVKHGDLELPPRQGRLFDPSSFPFLEGGLPGSTAAIGQPEARAQLRPPSVDDGIVHAALERLVLFEGQRLSYRALDVEQIGSIYESLMGYHVLRVGSPAVRIGKNRVWVQTGELRAMKTADRKKWLKQVCALSAGQIKKVNAGLKAHEGDDALAEVLNELSPGKKSARSRHRVLAGRLVLQPGDERRRSGSHYTPRSLTERIVRRTLEPIFACLGERPTEAQILSLKVCDPAMGSGAFLVETCRQLADQLVAVWTREGTVAGIAEYHRDPHLHARRLVAQRCLYGVDKNEAAVELAKLSLWLVTMSRELPFTFVDHSLRHGDSLVGLDLEQLSSFHWKKTTQVPIFAALLKDSLGQALEHRSEIHALSAYEDSLCQQEKRRLLDHAEHATEKIRMIADACVGSFFTDGKSSKARERERERRKTLVERWLGGEEGLTSDIRRLAEEIRENHTPFHWWLEFPEVFFEQRPDPLDDNGISGAAYMEAFVGNPPFMGQSRISRELGDAYRDWLFFIHPGSLGKSDLSPHFFRRSSVLMGPHGTAGMLAPNTIAQGDTRRSGLQNLLANGITVYDATTSLPWPGAAAVTVSVVHIAQGQPAKKVGNNLILDSREVSAIDSRLRPGPERDDAVSLSSNSGFAFLGCWIGGQGFTLTQEEFEVLAPALDPNGNRIRPYLSGEEINASPNQGFFRYVIDFAQLSLAEASGWPGLLDIVRERVKPDRDRQKRKAVRERWWQFGDVRPGLRKAIKNVERCLVTSRVTKHLSFSFQPNDRILSEAVCVFPLENYTAFAVLQSRTHEAWARLLSSSMKTDLRYAASDCFETFAFPREKPSTIIPAVESSGKEFYQARAGFMLETNQGLTKTYNALKDPTNTTPAILELRRLTEAMDRAVLDAYGWTDIEPPPYCPLTPAERAAHQAFEDEVIDRLYVLNAERAREEARLGLAGKKSKKQGAKKKRTKKKSSTAQADLFSSEDS
ncbi:N-6 DNA Methylase [Enhygromyxa salina]|uniref:site-specific DNA-methyltransferase (adenine-specific) n=1 Tax=Enhygromyxa salina TaxID=215803 RepID=A0A2S9Y2S7_9BACT|nr:type IIL restriction-modification enzyme MmeI [Enhygromyxa salina]PRP99389.1 N-6 DNA Methylase [Enhygromyxa salina]